MSVLVYYTAIPKLFNPYGCNKSVRYFHEQNSNTIGQKIIAKYILYFKICYLSLNCNIHSF